MSNHGMDNDVMNCISEQDIRGKDPELGTFVLDTDNPNRTISIFIVGTFKLRIKNIFFLHLHFSYSSSHQSSLQLLSGQNYHAGYRIKIKLICRLKQNIEIKY